MRYFSIVLLTLVLITSASYSQNFPSSQWEKVISPTFYGWDEKKLDFLQEYIIDSTATTGMMIIHEGKVIYQYGNISENSYIASCRKSILAMLYGKYVDNGIINLDQSLTDLGISCEGLLTDEEKEANVRDIISSRSGIYLPASNPGDMTHLAPERGEVSPGALWVYNNWDFNMAGHIFEKLTGHSIYDEIESQFAIPLQMQDWDKSIQEKDGDILLSSVLAYHIDFSTRDMARLGLLMLNNGKWNNKQIISESWVKEMTKPSTTFEEVDMLAPFLKNEISGFSYGYMWWLWDKPENKLLEGAYSAQGAWGQNITVIPKINTVVVIKTNDQYLRQKGNHHFIIDQIAQMYSPQLRDELKKLAESLDTNDINGFVKEFQASPTNTGDIDQDLINRLGYKYLGMEEVDAAISLFKLNVQRYPESWNVHDSLGEAYFIRGDFENSLRCFEKALLLNTENQWNRNKTLVFVIERIKKMTETNSAGK